MVKSLGDLVRVVPLALVLALAACGGAAAPTGTFTKFGDGVEVAITYASLGDVHAVRARGFSLGLSPLRREEKRRAAQLKFHFSDKELQSQFRTPLA